MKYTQLIIGIILFSGLIFIIFNASAEIGKTYQSNDYTTYERLANTYKNDTEYSTRENSTLQKIKQKADNAEFSIVSAAVGAIDSILQGAKLMIDSATTIDRLGSQVRQDTEGIIHPIIFTIINSIIVAVLIIIVFILIMKMKPET